MPRRERRQPTPRELAAITTPGLVVRNMTVRRAPDRTEASPEAAARRVFSAVSSPAKMSRMNSPGLVKGATSLDVATSRTPASLEAAAEELNRFIERRARKGEQDPDEQDELWKASVRVYHERRRRQNVAAWFAHFCRMADSHRALSEEYAQRAERLCED